MAMEVGMVEVVPVAKAVRPGTVVTRETREPAVSQVSVDVSVIHAATFSVRPLR